MNEYIKDEALLNEYMLFQKIVKEKTSFCKKNNYIGTGNANDYSRILAENELLKIKIQLIKRGL